MKTKTDFDFGAFIIKLKDLFTGFRFEELGHPNDPKYPPCLWVEKPMYGCCAFITPNHNPSDTTEDCIVTQLFNNQRKNLSLDALLVIPIALFDNALLITNLQQLLRFHIDERSEFFVRASLNSLIEIISSIETILNQHDANVINVTVKINKSLLNRKELIEYLS